MKYVWKVVCLQGTGEVTLYSSRAKAIVAGLMMGSGFKKIRKDYYIIVGIEDDGSKIETAIVTKELVL